MLSLRPGVLAVAWLASVGCGSLEDKTAVSEPDSKAKDSRAHHEPLPGHIVVTERGTRGGRLVLIAENGDRLQELTHIGPVMVRDNSPSWSPDGRWIAFASSRGRADLTQTSIWIVPAAPDAQPRRLTVGESTDNFPRFTPDGRALVFSSDRDGSFDLWRVELTMNARGLPMAASAPEKLTSGPDHDFHASVSPDGERLVFTRLAADRSGSRLWLLAGGQARPLTSGPVDATPAWSPDGQRIAFAGLAEAPAPDAGQASADLYIMRADGSERRLLVREPLADQTGPVWSADGRYVFCTSVYRLKDVPLLSSITFVDLREQPLVLRALHDRIGVVSRMEPTLDRTALDHAALRRNLPYDKALERALADELIRAQDR